jgi:hypothetical protein
MGLVDAFVYGMKKTLKKVHFSHYLLLNFNIML